ncbi:MAG: hypothetical protein E6I36_12205 [Chloroflexi bacterium]|nr:MAG: hypothetical protein E6I36_12205 [Chloroflexota bacterium]
MPASASSKPATISGAFQDMLTREPFFARVTSHVIVCGGCFANAGANRKFVRSSRRFGASTASTSETSAAFPASSSQRIEPPFTNSPFAVSR